MQTILRVKNFRETSHGGGGPRYCKIYLQELDNVKIHMNTLFFLTRPAIREHYLTRD